MNTNLGCNLRYTGFSPVWGASGTEGFSGEGYKFHKLLKCCCPGFDFTGMTFVSKTTTLYSNKGYLPLAIDGITPRELFPKCIIVRPFKEIVINGVSYRGVVLNSVGLSGPGLDFLLDQSIWQEKETPFQISFMSVRPDVEGRLCETRGFIKTLLQRMHFQTRFGVQINLSCPNVGLHRSDDDIVDEARATIDIADQLGLPIIIKINLLISPRTAKVISEIKGCDALCVTNTIPWGSVLDKPYDINWENIFGSKTSPLEKRGCKPGGLSGRFLKPLVIKWLKEAREIGLKGHINTGGGLSCADDVDDFYNAGASSVAVGATAAMFAPWNVQSIIQRARKLWKDA